MLGLTKQKLFAAGTAILATAATAAAASTYEPTMPEDSPDPKKAACGFIGCPNGKRNCGTTTVKLESGMEPIKGTVEASYVCYEDPPK